MMNTAKTIKKDIAPTKMTNLHNFFSSYSIAKVNSNKLFFLDGGTSAIIENYQNICEGNIVFFGLPNKNFLENAELPICTIIKTSLSANIYEINLSIEQTGKNLRLHNGTFINPIQKEYNLGPKKFSMMKCRSIGDFIKWFPCRNIFPSFFFQQSDSLVVDIFENCCNMSIGDFIDWFPYQNLQEYLKSNLQRNPHG